MIDTMQEREYHAGWTRDVYPTQEFLRSSVEKGEQYLAYVDGELAAAMILNSECNESYKNVHWPQDLDDSQVMIIHALGVLPKFCGRGIAREMACFAAKLAAGKGFKAVRLDVLKGNLPAEKAYTAACFNFIEELPMYYEDTGWTAFRLFELAV